MKESEKQISRLVNVLIVVTGLIVATHNARACSDCVFGPVVYTRGSGGPTVFAPSFVATPGPGVVDLNDLGTVGADGSVSLNGVVLMQPRSVTGEVGPRHYIVSVTLLANNNFVIKLTGKRNSKLQVTVTQTGASCYPNLPQPLLTLSSVGINVGGFDYYNLAVANYTNFPDALFAASPDLPPCGLNTSASRTWVDIYSGVDNSHLNGFCALSSASELNSIWFALPTGTAPPTSVYLTLTDRLCVITYTSSSLSLQACYPNLPQPLLTLSNVQSSGTGSDYYNLAVPNYTNFPDALFVASPDLPPCGLNTSASRTWVDIYNGDDNSRLNGFCSLSSASDLNSIWFALADGSTPPSSVYIVLTDRQCSLTYTSALATICYPNLPQPQLTLLNIQINNGGFDYYNLGVANYTSFPDALFVQSPELPACGLNTSASRTWVDIFSGDNTRLNGFCSLTRASDLNTIWFVLTTGSAPPASVYITLTDRLCNHVYPSTSINPSSP